MSTEVYYRLGNIRPQSARYLPPGSYLANVVVREAGYGCVNATVNVETSPMPNGGPQEALWQRANEYHKEMESAKQLAKELQDQLLKERQERREAADKIECVYQEDLISIRKQLEAANKLIVQYRNAHGGGGCYPATNARVVDSNAACGVMGGTSVSFMGKETLGSLESATRRMNEAMTNSVLGSGPHKRYEVYMHFTDGHAIRAVNALHLDSAITLAIQSARMAEGGPQFSGELISAHAKNPK